MAAESRLCQGREFARSGPLAQPHPDAADANAGATRHFGIPRKSYLGTFEVLVGLEQPEAVLISAEDEEVDLPAHVSLMPANRKLETVEQALLSQNKFIVL